MRVALKNNASNATSTAAMPAAARSKRLTSTPVESRIDAMGSSTMPSDSGRTSLPHNKGARPSRKNDSPIVAMNNVIGDWFTSFRSTKRSVARLINTMTPNAPIAASHSGKPCSIRPTTDSAAKYTIAPWAKLNTPDALKISTKPSATREYITPESSPPIRFP